MMTVYSLLAVHYGSKQPDVPVLIIHFPTCLGVSEQASKQSELCGASKWVCGASVWANRRVSGPVLTSQFIAVLNHSASSARMYGFYPLKYKSSENLSCNMLSTRCLFRQESDDLSASNFVSVSTIGFVVWIVRSVRWRLDEQHIYVWKVLSLVFSPL